MKSGSPKVLTPKSATSAKSSGSSSSPSSARPTIQAGSPGLDSPKFSGSPTSLSSRNESFSPSRSLLLPAAAVSSSGSKLNEKKEVKKEIKEEVKEVKHVRKFSRSTPIKEVSYQSETQADGQIHLSPHVIGALKTRVAQSIARVDKEHQKQERTWFREEDSYPEHLDIILKYKAQLYNNLNEYINKCSGQYRQKDAFFVAAIEAYSKSVDAIAEQILGEHRKMIQNGLQDEKLTQQALDKKTIEKLAIVQPTIQRTIDKFRSYKIRNPKEATAIRAELDKGEVLETLNQFLQVDALLKLRNHCKSGYLTKSDLFGTDGDDNIDGILHLFQSEVEHSSRTLSRFDDAQLKPLHYACILGHYELAEYCVVTKDANRTAKTKDDYSPIHLIVQNRHPNTEKLLNLLVRDHDELERKDPKGRTPLEIAATSGNLAAVKWLLMTIEAEDKVQKSKTVEDRCKGALHYAVIAGHTEIVDEILKYFCKKSGNYTAQRMSGHLPLYHAYLSGREDMVPLFASRSITLSVEERASLRALLLDKEAAAKDPVRHKNICRCIVAEKQYNDKIQDEMFGVINPQVIPAKKLVRSGSVPKGLSIFNSKDAAIAALRAQGPIAETKENKHDIQKAATTASVRKV